MDPIFGNNSSQPDDEITNLRSRLAAAFDKLGRVSAMQGAEIERLRTIAADHAAMQMRANAIDDENERLRAALRECGADWSSSPGTVMGAAAELGREFKRRMQIAADTLADEQKSDGKK